MVIAQLTSAYGGDPEAMLRRRPDCARRANRGTPGTPRTRHCSSPPMKPVYHRDHLVVDGGLTSIIG